MPANESYRYNLRRMHVIFALSSLAMLVTTLWMLGADHEEEWHSYQRTFLDIEAEKKRVALGRMTTEEYIETIQDLEKQLEDAEKELADYKKDNQKEFDQLESEIEEYTRLVDLKSAEVRSQRAHRDKARADLDLAIRDQVAIEVQEHLKKIFDEELAQVQELERELTELEDELARYQSRLNAVTEDRDEIIARIGQTKQDVERFQDELAKIDPDAWLPSLKRKAMELPIIDGFNSHLRIHQDWLPDLKIKLGMAETARFDRCRTCHLGIDRVEAGNIAEFPHGDIESNDIADWVHHNKYPHPYSTHPNTDLYVTATSPHPVNRFGCTICHEGQGSGTAFSTAAHYPNDPHQFEEWEHEYDFKTNHFWEYPMYPKRFAESSCVKCHHNVTELAYSENFGNSAPKLVRGYNLVKQFGCFGCHEINGYDAGKPIGPDLRLEPSTQEEALRIANDPNLIAGTMRKVGPALTHVKSKTTQQWLEYWIEEPKRFRPTTRMPQFFDLTNQQDETAHDLQPVEIAAVSKYLLKVSQPIDFDSPVEDYVPDAERGRKLFSQRGCLSCHSHAEFSGIDQDFGPDLSRVGAKLHTRQQGGVSFSDWLYTWIREPTRYHPRTKMPDLFLDPYEENEVTIDPAADVTAFLMESSPSPGSLPDYKNYPRAVGGKSGEENGPLNELVKLYLSKALSPIDVDITMSERQYLRRNQRVPKEQIKGDEIELWADGPVDEETWRDMQLDYVGRRTISRYGCYGCHDVPGFEDARPIGTTLQDWGRKDTSKIAFEHIAEYLHHHGEADGSSTQDRVVAAMRDAQAGAEQSEELEHDLSAAYFYEDIMHHDRAGFLWQKLRQPRSYDYEKIETKGYDERLRMPRFQFSADPVENEQAIEAIATFILGLVAEPPAEQYIFNPSGREKDRLAGEEIIDKYNCSACHVVELPEFTFGVLPQTEGLSRGVIDYESDDGPLGMTRDDLIAWFVDHRDEILNTEVPKQEDLVDEDDNPIDEEEDVDYGFPDSVDLVLANAKSMLEGDHLRIEWAHYIANLVETDLPADQQDGLYDWFDSHHEILIGTLMSDTDYPNSIRMLLEFQYPRNGVAGQKFFSQRDFANWLVLLIENETELEETESEIQSLEAEIERLEAELKKPDAEVESIQSELESSRSRLQRRQASLLELNEIADRLARQIRQLEIRKVNTAEFDQFGQELIAAEVDIDEMLYNKEERPYADYKQRLEELYEKNHRHLLAVCGQAVVQFHGMIYEPPIEDDPFVDQEYSIDLWESLDLGGRYLLPTTKMLIPARRLMDHRPGRGGEFTYWLVEQLRETETDGNRYVAWQASPPPLVNEGAKVQTTWLYQFLKNPYQIRHTTVLRMPKFDLSDEEIGILANYFAAKQHAEYPYLNIPQREPHYIAEMNERFADLIEDDHAYLQESWNVLNGTLCIRCHAVGGRMPQLKAVGGEKPVRGPDLNQVPDRLRPDYSMIWLYNPAWLLPYTSMPQNFQRGKVALPNFSQNGAAQLRATRDALLNYHRLVETEYAESLPPVEPMDTPPTDDVDANTD